MHAFLLFIQDRYIALPICLNFEDYVFESLYHCREYVYILYTHLQGLFEYLNLNIYIMSYIHRCLCKQHRS